MTWPFASCSDMSISLQPHSYSWLPQPLEKWTGNRLTVPFKKARLCLVLHMVSNSPLTYQGQSGLRLMCLAWLPHTSLPGQQSGALEDLGSTTLRASSPSPSASLPGLCKSQIILVHAACKKKVCYCTQLSWLPCMAHFSTTHPVHWCGICQL